MLFKKHKGIINYAVAGGLSYLIELTLLMFLTRVLNLNVGIAVSISFWLGIVTSFSLQKIIGYKNYNKELSAISKQFSFFLVLVFFNYVFTLLLTSIIDEKYLLFSRTLAISLVTLWNYIILKKIFNNPPTLLNNALTKLKNKLVQQRSVILITLFSSTIILVFFWQYVGTHNRLIGGDFDYYAQLYEAFRISVLKYGQFPLWNPWMSGGLPLFSNPQFGLFSIQSIYVLLFGTIFGLKLAYVTYAIAGFWGMYFVSRRLKADRVRSLLVGLLWVFGGYFAGHSIAHFTFSLFFLFPWIIYFFINWKRHYSWLWLGLLFSLIVLSSFHYGFLMMGMGSVIIAFTYIVGLLTTESNKKLHELKKYLLFLIKTVAVFSIAAGYRIVTTYLFVESNSRPTALFIETPPGLNVIFQALFLPVGSIIDIPSGLQWGWGEYSSYLGLGASIAFLFALIITASRVRKNKSRTKQRLINLAIFVLFAVCILLALGDFHTLSPFNVLRHVPGFSETRVSSRWLIFVSFSILFFLASFKKYPKVINILLFFAVVELFVIYGPINRPGSQFAELPLTNNFEYVIKQYDTKNMDRSKVQDNIDYSYFYSTSRNIGQIYSDDSIINTLNGVLDTNRCGENINPECDLIQSDNAVIQEWSPNYIKLLRTQKGEIKLNMNVYSGWRINDIYPYTDYRQLNPEKNFILPDDDRYEYELKYAPKLSPEWLRWKIKNITVN